MVEPVLYFVLGVLVAGVAALFLGKAIWRRAVRLTARRVLRTSPVSASDITVAVDLARADHAFQVNRLERKAMALTRRIADHMAEIGRQKATIQRLHALLSDRQTEAGAQQTLQENLENALMTAQQRFERLELDYRTAEEHRAEFKQKYTDTRDSFTNLETQMNAQTAQLAAVSSENTSLTQRIGHMQAELDNVRMDVKHEIEERVKAQHAVRAAQTRIREEMGEYVAELEGNVEKLKIEKAMLEGALSSARARTGNAPVPSADTEYLPPLSTNGEHLSLQVAQWTNATSNKIDPARMLRNRSAARLARRKAANDAPLPEVAEKR